MDLLAGEAGLAIALAIAPWPWMSGLAVILLFVRGGWLGGLLLDGRRGGTVGVCVSAAM